MEPPGTEPLTWPPMRRIKMAEAAHNTQFQPSTSEYGKLQYGMAQLASHLDAAYNLARWLVRNETDAEDVVHDAYVRAFRYLHAFAKARAGLGCWRSSGTLVMTGCAADRCLVNRRRTSIVGRLVHQRQRVSFRERGTPKHFTMPLSDYLQTSGKC